ncbi:hypothetical protein ABT354_34135 [Streptomyces sp. NPDC000594]|uniref:hypothetical protein n=1 Tax=unclassified Streptomyces TaxID=2593676 RepID=UPI00331AEFCA
MATNDLDLDLNTTTDPTPARKQTETRFAEARAWWKAAWNTGGVLHGLWEDLRLAPQLGWHSVAPWIKALILVVGFSFVTVLFADATGVLLDGLDRLLTTSSGPAADRATTGIWAAIDTPVRSYLTAHTQGLPVDASTAYALWQITGLVGLVGGFLRITAARTLWVTWAAASIAMIWQAAPDTGRTVATGIAVLAWILASAIALRGLTLRPVTRRGRPAHRPAPVADTGVQAHHTR